MASRAGEKRSDKAPRQSGEPQKGRKQVRRVRSGGLASGIGIGRRSLLLFGVGGLSLVVGYVALAAGSITLAPVLLVAGYCVFFPMGILMKDRPRAQSKGE